MTFLYPLALLALIAVPLLILIYILKNKYKEEKQPSTYIWEVSEKFLKKKNPLHNLERIISLLIEIAAVVFLSLALAHPIFTLKEAADDIVFILDASASMNMVHDGKTRFDEAKEKILAVASDCADGSSWTLVLANDDTKVVCSQVEDIDTFTTYLNDTKVGYDAIDLEDSLNTAQTLFTAGKCNVCYLATDRKIDESKVSNVNLLSVAHDDENYAITELEYKLDKNVLTFSGSVISYATDRYYDEETGEGSPLTVQFYIEDYEIPASIQCDVYAGIDYYFSVDIPLADYASQYVDSEFSSVTAKIADEDCLPIDNTMIVYSNDASVHTSVLLVTKKNFYLQSIMKALGTCDITTVKPTAYHANEKAYDVTIFDGYCPDELPEFGAIWFFGVDSFPSAAGCISQDDTARAVKEDDEDEGTLKYAENDGVLYQQLTKQLKGNDILIKEYYRYTMFDDFTTILTYDNYPMVFAGKNSDNRREVVFAFDLHDSNLPLQYDFVVLMRNFITYSNPEFMDEFNYQVNSDAIFSVSDTTSAIDIITPSEKTDHVYLDGSEVQTYQVEEVGTYTINQTVSDDVVKTYYVYASYPSAEGNSQAEYTKDVILIVTPNTVKGDGILDNIIPIIIIAAIFFAGDWVVYAHGQY